MPIKQKKRYRPNLNEVAYEEIKNMILTGELAQGERILLDKMAEQMDLSITPVREALNKLAQDDLIKMTPRTSYEVVSLTKNDISEIIDLRELLEIFALRSDGALESFPVEEMRAMFTKSYCSEKYMDFVEASTLLHKTIISNAQSQKLKKLYDFIYNSIRILAIPSAKVPGRIEESIHEHLVLLEEIEKGNLEKAVELLSRHIREVKEVLLREHDERAMAQDIEVKR